MYGRRSAVLAVVTAAVLVAGCGGSKSKANCVRYGSSASTLWACDSIREGRLLEDQLGYACVYEGAQSGAQLFTCKPGG